MLLAPAVMFAKPGHICCRRNGSTSGAAAGAAVLSLCGTTRSGRSTYAFLRGQPSIRSRSTPSFAQPTLIFQGLRDASVDYRTVEQFANARPNVTLSLLDDDHQLIASLPRMWNDIQPFLGLIE